MSGKRGRETALDMVRTLGIVMAVVIPLWYFGQASESDKARIRAVDPAPALQDFHAETNAPVPTTPAGWTVTVARGDVGQVRIGYVVGEHYTEFIGGSGPTFLADITGKATDRGPLPVAGQVWRDYVNAAGQESLVRRLGKVTLVIGGIREDVTKPQLTALAATVR
ncbi:MAG: hypothetical protein JWN31_586 [Frankiales bacterium]|nr:hypothetical protein [Frankiales bacterium]